MPRSTIDYAGEIMERIQANPSIVGRGASLATSFAGAGNSCGRSSGWIRRVQIPNTKTRDDAEGLREITVWLRKRSRWTCPAPLD